MHDRQINKAQARLNAARSDFWEAGYFYETSRRRERRTAKHTARRAARRAARLLCRTAG